MVLLALAKHYCRIVKTIVHQINTIVHQINTACSSSLVAVHHAVQSLCSHSANMYGTFFWCMNAIDLSCNAPAHRCIVGGVNLLSSAFTHHALKAAQMLSPTGSSHAFDRRVSPFLSLAKVECSSAHGRRTVTCAAKDASCLYCVAWKMRFVQVDFGLSHIFQIEGTKVQSYISDRGYQGSVIYFR